MKRDPQDSRRSGKRADHQELFKGHSAISCVGMCYAALGNRIMDLEKIFVQTLQPSLGCTELASIAFTVAAAAQATSGWSPERRTTPLICLSSEEVGRIHVQVNQSIFKNAFSVYIPNTAGQRGVVMAAALGAFCDPREGLQLFRNLKSADVAKARELIQARKVKVEIVEAEQTDLYIQARVLVQSGPLSCMGSSVVKYGHTNLIFLKRGEEMIYHQPSRDEQKSFDGDLDELKSLTFQELIQAVEHLPVSVMNLIRKTIALNKKATETGLAQPLGLGVGFRETHGKENLDLVHHISSVAAAGSDARMSGHPVEVMSSAGSGNQGIVATIPVVAYCEIAQIDEDRLLKAVALSHLVTMYMTMHVGALSALCGAAIKAGIGAACGITYAMGGQGSDICRAVKIMIASIAGVICDGAKPGCALKVSSSSAMAVRAAILAMGKLDISETNGIVGRSAEDTVRNLSRLDQSMKAVDDKIVQILQEKLPTTW